MPTALALLGYGALTVAVLRPTPWQVAHTTPAFQGLAADALLLIWATSHVSRALFRAPLHLFDAGIFHPAHYTLAWGDHMIGEALVGLPLWLTTHNPLLEYNVLVLASYVLGATATFAYAREAIGGAPAAAAAGLVFAFTPFRFHSPLWLQVLFTPFMPLALLFWIRFVRRLQWGDWGLWVGSWLLHSLMGMYLALYFALTMGALGALALIAAPTRRAPRLWAGTLAAPLACLLLLAPTLWPYLHLRAVQGHVREAGLDTHLSFFLPGPGTLTGALLGLRAPARFGPGLVVWALAALGIVAGWRRARRDPSARFTWQAHATGLAVTLGLVLIPMRLQLRVPGLDMLRNTDRAFFVGLLFLAVLTGEAVRWLAGLAATPRARTVIVTAVLAALAIDMGTPPRERKWLPVGAEVPAAYRWLRHLPDTAVVYDGVAGIEGPALSMYYAIFHERRLANGYNGFVSPGAAYVTHRLHEFPAPPALELLHALRVSHVLWHLSGAAAADAFAAALPPSVAVSARSGGDLVCAVGEPPPRPAVAASVWPLPRAGWTLRASAAATVLEALRDGDPRTAWRETTTPGGGVPWLTIDLGRPEPVAGIRCRPPRANAPGTYFAHVDVSDDGDRWEALPTRFEPTSLAVLLDHPADLDAYEMRFPTRRTRYVRLVNPELAFWGGPWEIAELDVLADTGAPVP